jgi:hypothetical protein
LSRLITVEISPMPNCTATQVPFAKLRRRAAVRGKTHPEKAVMLYKKLLPHVVNAGSRGTQYSAAFEIVKAIQELRAGQGQDDVFKQEVVELRLAWKAKRNFMKLLATLD